MLLPLDAFVSKMTRATWSGIQFERVLMASELIRITINGEARDIPAGTTLADLLRLIDRNPRFLAVERNLELVPRTQHEQCVLAERDELEIVTLVGGG
jgi:thiamine biosynthesis protein ThiS